MAASTACMLVAYMLFASGHAISDLDTIRGPVTGSVLTFSLNGVRSLAAGLIPIIERSLPAKSLPDVMISKASFDVTIHNIQCEHLLIGGVGVQTYDTGHERVLQLQAFNASVDCNAEFTFREQLWPHWPSGDGALKLTMRSADAGSIIAVKGKWPGQISCDSLLPGDEVTLRPGLGRRLCLATRSIQVDVGTLDVTFTRGIPGFRWLVQLIVDVFQKTVADFVSDALEDALRHAIDEAASSKLENATGLHTVHLPLSEADMGLRTTLSNPPAVHGNHTYEPGKGHIDLQFRADVIPDISRPHARLPLHAPPAAQLGQTAPAHHVQLWLSNYSVVSPVYALAMTGVNVTHALPDEFNTTRSWETFIPQLPEAYGEETRVGLRLALQKSTPALNVSSWPAEQGSTQLAVLTAMELLVFTKLGEQDVAVRWNATLGSNASIWIPLDAHKAKLSPHSTEAAHTARIHVNISRLSFNLSETDLWSNPKLGPDPIINTGALNRLFTGLFDHIITPLINRAFKSGLRIPLLPLGPVPSRHGQQDMMLCVALVRPQLVAGGPIVNSEGIQPTNSAGWYLRTDLELVLRPMKEVIDPMGVFMSWLEEVQSELLSEREHGALMIKLIGPTSVAFT